MKRVVAALVVLTACMCAKESSYESRWAGLGAAQLFSEFQPRDMAVMHILFVPEFAPPEGGAYGTGGGGGPARERGEITDSYFDASRKVQAQPIVIIERKYLACGTQRFNLADGNLFVVHVTPDGKTSATQLHNTLRARSEAAEVLAFVKKALPNDRWLQAIKPTNAVTVKS